MEEMQVFNSPAFPYALFNREGETMKREFQIRENDDWGNESVTHFTDLASANKYYYRRLTCAQEEGLSIEFELIEVLLQDHSKNNAHKSNMSHDLTTVRPIA